MDLDAPLKDCIENAENAELHRRRGPYHNDILVVFVGILNIHRSQTDEGRRIGLGVDTMGGGQDKTTGDQRSAAPEIGAEGDVTDGRHVGIDTGINGIASHNMDNQFVAALLCPLLPNPLAGCAENYGLSKGSVG